MGKVTVAKERKHQYYLDNKEWILERSKIYYLDHKDTKKEYAKNYRLQNHEVIITKDKARRLSNLEKYQEREREYYYSNLEKRSIRGRERRRGMPKGSFIELFESQERKCAICRKDLIICSKDTHWDHDSKTGKARGILCSGCNTGIGNFYENINSLLEATKYLEMYYE